MGKTAAAVCLCVEVNSANQLGISMPRQLYIMQAADDGSFYWLGKIYKYIVHSGSMKSPFLYETGNVKTGLHIFIFLPHQQKVGLIILYTAPKLKMASRIWKRRVQIRFLM